MNKEELELIDIIMKTQKEIVKSIGKMEKVLDFLVKKECSLHKQNEQIR